MLQAEKAEKAIKKLYETGCGFGFELIQREGAGHMWVSEQQEQVCVSIVCLDPTIEATLLFLYILESSFFFFLQEFANLLFHPKPGSQTKPLGGKWWADCVRGVGRVHRICDHEIMYWLRVMSVTKKPIRI